MKRTISMVLMALCLSTAQADDRTKNLIERLETELPTATDPAPVHARIGLLYMRLENPDSAEALNTMLELLPEGMVKALGFQNMGTDLTGYLSNYLYGFIFLTFPMIYCAIMANRLIAKHVDSGSMAYLLTTPHSRVRIATTQAIYLAASVLAIMLINVGLAILMSEPGNTDWEIYSPQLGDLSRNAGNQRHRVLCFLSL